MRLVGRWVRGSVGSVGSVGGAGPQGCGLWAVGPREEGGGRRVGRGSLRSTGQEGAGVG